MADQDTESELLEWIEDLQQENHQLSKELFIANSIINEFRQALSGSQLSQAQLNGQLKLANQPTA